MPYHATVVYVCATKKFYDPSAKFFELHLFELPLSFSDRSRFVLIGNSFRRLSLLFSLSLIFFCLIFPAQSFKPFHQPLPFLGKILGAKR